MFRISLFLVFISFFSTQILSQELSKSQKSNEYRSKIEDKGIVFIDTDFELSVDDFSAIYNFSFDQYRNEKSSRIIQLLNGPKIELLSFEQLKTRGVTFDNDVYQSKIGEQINNQEKKLITLVNVGLGIKSVEAPY
jgi:hypothetical protein